MLLRRQQSNCSTPPHRVPWENKHTSQSVNCFKGRQSDPVHAKRIRGAAEPHVSLLLCRTSLQMYKDQPYSHSLQRTGKILEKWSLPNVGTRMTEKGKKRNFFLSSSLSSFPLFPIIATSHHSSATLPNSPPFQQNPSTFMSFFITSSFLPALTYPLCPSSPLQIFVLIQLIL